MVEPPEEPATHVTEAVAYFWVPDTLEETEIPLGAPGAELANTSCACPAEMSEIKVINNAQNVSFEIFIESPECIRGFLQRVNPLATDFPSFIR